MKHHIGLKIMLYISIMAACMVLYISYLLLIPIHVIDMKTLPIPVKTKKVVQGEALIIEVNYCKHVKVSALNTYSFLNHNAVPSITNRSNLPVGCHHREIELVTPLILLPGKYSLLYSAEYQVNSLRNEKYQWESEMFEVLPATGEASLKKKYFKTLSSLFIKSQ